MPERRIQLIVIKPSDQAVTSSTVLVNETALAVPVPANAIMHVQWDLWVTSDGTSGTGAGNLEVAVTVPAGCTMTLTAQGVSTVGVGIPIPTTASGTGIQVGSNTGGAGRSVMVTVIARLTNGVTAGTATLQFAQGVSSGDATTVKAGSCVTAST